MLKKQCFAVTIIVVFVFLMASCQAKTQQTSSIPVEESKPTTTMIMQTAEFNHVQYCEGEVNYLAYDTDGLTWYVADTIGTVKKSIPLAIPDVIGSVMQIRAVTYCADSLWLVVAQSDSQGNLHSALLWLDDNGTLLSAQELTGLLATPPQAIAQQDNLLYVASDTAIFVLDYEGTIGQVLDASGYVQQLVHDSAGVLYCVLSSGPIYQINEYGIDLQNPVWKLSLGQSLSTGCAGYDFLISGREQLFGLTLESKEAVILLDWSDQALLDGMAQGVCYSDNNS